MQSVFHLLVPLEATEFASEVLGKETTMLPLWTSGLSHAHNVHEPSLFAYWLWSCVVTVLILLTKYWRPRDVTLLNYFLKPRGITSACWKCSTDGRSISLAATIRPPPILTPHPRGLDPHINPIPMMSPSGVLVVYFIHGILYLSFIYYRRSVSPATPRVGLARLFILLKKSLANFEKQICSFLCGFTYKPWN
jgi:hypothetical protein